ncbi:SMC5-SMC6 complex localization factor protein 2 isoform X1 [Paramormyrops kingsleyae]|nr:SMC5-SMC6 complex localization factor protein 2-like isoform X1 [Paramormyrops kingsleyae]XP_023678247.1 SMC5-SMC6 complex localization factor protein 2-like isoform X1 [Paramormyrops kingsleyae]
MALTTRDPVPQSPMAHMTQQGTTPGKGTAMSSLRQHFEVLVRDFIPLGGPRHAGVDDKRSRHSKPGVRFLEPPQKTNQTQRSANSLSRQALVLEKPEMKMQVPSVLLKRIPNSSSASLAATGSASLHAGAVHREWDPGYRSNQVRSRSLEGATPGCSTQVPSSPRIHSGLPALLPRSSETPHQPENESPKQTHDSQIRHGGASAEQSPRMSVPINAAVGGSAAVCPSSSVKRKAGPAVEGMWQGKRAYSGTLGSDITGLRPTRDLGLNKEENSPGVKVLQPDKPATPLCSQQAQNTREAKLGEPAQAISQTQMEASRVHQTWSSTSGHRKLESNQTKGQPVGKPPWRQPVGHGMDSNQRLVSATTPPPTDQSDTTTETCDPISETALKALPDSPVKPKSNTSSSRSVAAPCVPDRWDPLDLELELDLGLGACQLSSSSESEDEPLLSLQQILERSAQPPTTPQKGTFSEPGTPQTKALLPPMKNSQLGPYRNTLETMLKEKEHNARLKDIEMKVLLSCKENLQKLEEQSEEVTEEAVSQEHRDFLQRFYLVSSAIPDLHPGEEIFMLANFGRLFSLQNLDLRRCAVTPQNVVQKTLLQADAEKLPLLVSAGLLLKAYRSVPCPPAVSFLLFQMMSIHPDRKTSTQILRSMKHIAIMAAEQIVENKNREFQVWTPSLREVALIFLNMGVPFITLFTLQSLQPPFSEGDLLQSELIQTEHVQDTKPVTFPEHNVENVIKYLALSTSLASKAYSDDELFLLLTATCKLSLETRLQLLTTEDLRFLLEMLLDNSRDWDTQLPRICLALADLSDDHHNLRRLVHLLPHTKRGKQLRRHVSVTIISKLLDHRFSYKPTNSDFQLAVLRPFIPHMRPSLLLKVQFPVREGQAPEDGVTSQDQQAYYLCYSLLILINEASNFESLPLGQKKHLHILSAELEKHIKCDIRETEKCLYRSKVKDFVARIYTRWQILLQKSGPSEGLLYDYWQPLPEDAGSDSQQSQSNTCQDATICTDVPEPDRSSSSPSQLAALLPDDGHTLNSTAGGS